MSWEGSRSLLFSGSCSLALVASYFQVVGWWYKIQTSFPQFNHAMCDFDICKSILLIIKSMLHYAFYTKNVMHFPFSQLIFVSECKFFFSLSSVQFSSVAQSCQTLCDLMNCSTPGLPVHHHLPEFTQTHVHRVSDAIQPSHLLSSLFPPAPNTAQHQSLFQWVNSLHEVAKVLEFQL